MAKLTLNLPSGVKSEKTIINYFKKDNNSYVILDAESVGPMGLPLILVSKYVDGRLSKIVDQEEWTKVKGFLKQIIAEGGSAPATSSFEYMPLDGTSDADEIYFTQLTLPIASFDALKKAYIPKLADVSPSPIQAPVSSVGQMNEVPIMEAMAPENPRINDEVNPVSSVDSIPAVLPDDTIPAVSPAPSAEELPIDNSTGDSPVTVSPNEPVANPLLGNIDINKELAPAEEKDSVPTVAPEVQETKIEPLEPVAEPVSTPAESATNENSYEAEKQAFLKACENMFDALISKFEAKRNI